MGKGSFIGLMEESIKGNIKMINKEGFGIFEWPDGGTYIGPWHEGKQHGIGTYINSKGKKRQGQWEKGKRIAWIKRDTEGNKTS